MHAYKFYLQEWKWALTVGGGAQIETFCYSVEESPICLPSALRLILWVASRTAL